MIECENGANSGLHVFPVSDLDRRHAKPEVDTRRIQELEENVPSSPSLSRLLPPNVAIEPSDISTNSAVDRASFSLRCLWIWTLTRSA